MFSDDMIMLYLRSIMSGIAIMIVFFAALGLYSQIPDPERLEEVLENISEESDLTIQLDEVEALSRDPIDLSRADVEILMKIPGISPALAEKILKTVETGDINSIKDLSDKLNLTEEQNYLLDLCTFIEPSEKYSFSK
mgnify:CR=1 FL=1